MTVIEVLGELEVAGLVRPEPAAPESEYAFRHGLFQDTAYQLLLNREREWLHRQVGSALEDCYPVRTDELAAIFGSHFLLGDDRPRALRYLRQAAGNARNSYANLEALESYSAALEVAGQLDQPLDRADLLHERGLTYEMIGDFESSLADFRTALSLAKDLEQPELEWQALLDLGKLWAAKDYQETGEYFQQVLRVARDIGDETIVAASLNRLANWHTNLGDADQAKRDQQEAIAIYDRLGDQQGVAETLDFLGIASMISGDPIRATIYYELAIDLLSSLGDKQRLASALTSYAMRIGNTHSETVVGVDTGEQEALANLEEALRLSQELGWRSGESFALWMRSFLACALGRFDLALESGQRALDLAEEGNHIQWMTASSCSLGRTHLELFDDEAALELTERSEQLAQRTGSRHWIGTTVGMKALACLATGDLEAADRALAESAASDPGMELLGDRLYWTMVAELRLARGQFDQALELLDALVDSAPGFKDGKVIPRLFRDRGRAHLGLNHLEPARRQLEAALSKCRRQGWRALQWRLHGDLSHLELESGNEEEAKAQLAAARASLAWMAQWIADRSARRRFLERAQAELEALYPQVSNVICRPWLGGRSPVAVGASILCSQRGTAGCETPAWSGRSVEELR